MTPYSIFVVHPSALLTDHEPHGDGLVAHGFITALARRGHRLHVAAPAVAIRDALPENVCIHVLSSRTGSAALSRLEYMARVRVLFRRLQPTVAFDLLHQLNPVDAGLSLALADVDRPMVLGPYVPAWPPSATAGRISSRIGARANRAVREWQERRASALLLTTPAAASKLGAGPPPSAIVRELPHGIDEQWWRPSAHVPDSRDVLFLANLEPRKGIFDLLEAFERLVRAVPSARLVIAGTGSAATEVGRIVSGSSIASRVEMTGNVPRAQVRELMGACSVYCLPSIGEPFGMTVLEAMACGKPVVVTDSGGARYLVDDRGGRRVAPGDVAALAAALAELLTAPDRRREMGAHNRAVVEERFAWSRVIARLEDIYAEVISRALR